MVDLCFKTGEMEVHTEGMVRVAHPGHGMGLVSSRTPEQRAQVENLINFLRSSSDRTPELYVSPRALVADLTQFEPSEILPGESSDELEDELLELIRRGAMLQQDESSWKNFGASARRKKLPFRLACLVCEFPSIFFNPLELICCRAAASNVSTVKMGEAFRGIVGRLCGMELVLGGQVGRTCAGARGFSCDPVAKNRRTRSRLRRGLSDSWSVPPQCEKDI